MSTALFIALFFAATPDALSSAVEASLPAELALEHAALRNGKLPAGAAELAVDWRSPPRAGTMTVLVSWRDQSGRAQRAWADLRIAAKRYAIVATRALKAGEGLKRSDITRALVAAGDEALDLDPRALSAATVKRDVRAGAALGAADLEMPPPVARGTALKIVSRFGAAEITTEGVLERSARPGEWSAARTKVGSRVVHGLLLDAHTLLVEGGSR